MDNGQAAGVGADELAPEKALNTAPAKQNRARIIGLDGVRGLGCLGVAVAHVAGHYSPLTTAAGKLNLIGMVLLLFFVLSGFLLFLPYVRGLTRERGALKLPNTKQYALHRVLRVLPAYLVIFLVVNYVLRIAYVTNPSLVTPGTDEGTGTITDPWQLISNLTLVQTYIPKYFQTGINPSWSLTLEIVFYLSLPLLGLLLFGLRRRTNIAPLKLALLAPVILLAIGFVGKLFVPALAAHEKVTDPLMMDWGDNWVAVYLRSFLTNADCFAYGMFVVILFVAMEQGVIGERLSRRIRLIAIVAFFPALLVALGLLMLHSVFALSSVAFVAGIFVVIVVAPLARGESSKLATALDFAPARFIGKISLSVYLWHFPILLLMGRWGLMHGDSVGEFLLNSVIVLGVSIALSVVTYYLIEQPALNLAKKYKPKARNA
ncbi:acyltransferase [Mycolicibacterium sp.]|uniref:acyltransferase family protein n=1 Tax=Mycolicibacterium sp. TaxID=2320850 RepID=UPI001A355BE2|nr:acyltransferase [Mycolicibacterium sp.]MBJ7339082.1 acyltransferase [Mycolicibacterium sp.]